MTGHYGDESSQVSDCTGINNQGDRNKITHVLKTQKNKYSNWPQQGQTQNYITIVLESPLTTSCQETNKPILTTPKLKSGPERMKLMKTNTFTHHQRFHGGISQRQDRTM